MKKLLFVMFISSITISLQSQNTLFRIQKDGVSGQQEVVAVFESDASNRPAILLSEGGTNFSDGMSIEYNGSPVAGDKEMYINGINGDPILIVSNFDRVGINENNPSANLFIKQVGPNVEALTMENDTDEKQWSFEIGSSDLLLSYNGVFRGGFDSSNGTYYVASDRSLKQEIEPMDEVLGKLMQLSPKKYFYKTDESKVDKTSGFIAQDLLEIFPDLVSGSEENHLAVNYSGMSTLLVKAVQEQQTIIDAQQKEIDELRKLTESNAAMIKELSSKIK